MGKVNAMRPSLAMEDSQVSLLVDSLLRVKNSIVRIFTPLVRALTTPPQPTMMIGRSHVRQQKLTCLVRAVNDGCPRPSVPDLVFCSFC